MKSKVLVLALLMAFGLIAQKKKNGTVYIEHPAINTVSELNDAWVKGDSAKISMLLADDFKSYNGINTNKEAKGGSKERFINGLKWWHENFNHLSIEPTSGAYPDAIEYADSGMWVQSWDHMKGVHKTTGVKLDMPVHRLYQMNDEGKVKTIINYTNTMPFREIWTSEKDLVNGTIYKNHENINTVRKMIHAMEFGQFDEAYSYFSPDARFRDLEMPAGKTMSLEEDKEWTKKFLEDFEIRSIDVRGYPDYLEYDLGDQKDVLSWWNFYLLRKSDQKKITFPVMFIHGFNDEGKITDSMAYYSSAVLKEAGDKSATASE
ncbi:nuclear transport factor 2 family protein [Zeaxanthinibacter enoshimensis]|uniref:SnoaL-like protein n=1 Tax=Zeaxanthinibacter enoshimensis TaxID=392009 RepID=A0A4R6TL21_9FLAO|nr:nuclear transport factor 2 family protein [Zeaxanthinibacter enoshimensis]TDQ31377.1 SnoaL-like protein [Zeaxanthinibacter enoshimensis]